MIYQHRLVIARGGRLVKRHVAFQREAMGALEAHGSVLIGAWEVWIGADAGCGVYQIRQFESLAAWEQHRERVHKDAELNERYQSNLSFHNDFVTTSIVNVRMAHRRSRVSGRQWMPCEARRELILSSAFFTSGRGLRVRITGFTLTTSHPHLSVTAQS